MKKKDKEFPLSLFLLSIGKEFKVASLKKRIIPYHDFT